LDSQIAVDSDRNVIYRVKNQFISLFFLIKIIANQKTLFSIKKLKSLNFELSVLEFKRVSTCVN